MTTEYEATHHPGRAARVALLLLLALLPGRVLAQAVGDPVDRFLDATGAVATDRDGVYRTGSAYVRLRAPGGVLAGLELDVALDQQGVADAADVLSIASGYGAGIREPLASFLQERAPALAGEGGRAVRLEAYELRVQVEPGDPSTARLSLTLPRVPPERFGDEAASLGPDDAPVTVRVFSDFQCPFCRRYAQEAMPRLASTLLASDEARFAFHHFPLDGIHANAGPAAEAAQCVADRYGDDAFWGYHDLLFERQAAWQDLGEVEPYLARLAGRLPDHALGDGSGSDVRPREAVAACLAEGRAAPAVDAARDRARALELSGTPTVFVGGYRLASWGDPVAYARLVRLARAVADDAAAAP